MLYVGKNRVRYMGALVSQYDKEKYLYYFEVYSFMLVLFLAIFKKVHKVLFEYHEK
jgi:hypothetical protein